MYKLRLILEVAINNYHICAESCFCVNYPKQNQFSLPSDSTFTDLIIIYHKYSRNRIAPDRASTGFLLSLFHHQCKNHSHSIYISYIKQSVDDLKILNDVCKLKINITTFHDGFQRSKIWKFLEQYLAIIYLRNMVKKNWRHITAECRKPVSQSAKDK